MHRGGCQYLGKGLDGVWLTSSIREQETKTVKRQERPHGLCYWISSADTLLQKFSDGYGEEDTESPKQKTKKGRQGFVQF